VLAANTDAAAQLAAQRQQAAQQLAANPAPVAAEDYLGFLSAINALGGLVSGQQLRDPAQELLAQRKQERDEHTNRMLLELRQASDDARRIDQEQQLAARRAGWRDTAYALAARIPNPEVRAGIYAAADKDGESAAKMAQDILEEERRALDARENRELRYLQLAEQRIRTKIAQEEHDVRMQIKKAENFDQLPAGEQLKLTEKQLAQHRKQGGAAGLDAVTTPLLKLQALLGGFDSDRARSIMGRFVGIEGIGRSQLSRGTDEEKEAYRLLNSIISNRAFALGGKQLTTEEKKIIGDAFGYVMGKGGVGNIGQDVNQVLSGLSEIQGTLAAAIDRQTVGYYPPVVKKLREEGDVTAPGYYRELSAIAQQLGGRNIEKPPPGVRNVAKYEAAPLSLKLELWKRALDAGQVAPSPAPESRSETLMEGVTRSLPFLK
jgi:hypothetical protein